MLRNIIAIVVNRCRNVKVYATCLVFFPRGRECEKSHIQAHSQTLIVLSQKVIHHESALAWNMESEKCHFPRNLKHIMPQKRSPSWIISKHVHCITLNIHLESKKKQKNMLIFNLLNPYKKYGLVRVKYGLGTG